MQRKVKFTIETQEEPQIIESYKATKNHKDEYGEDIKIKKEVDKIKENVSNK